jgi:hypothetical protein
VLEVRAPPRPLALVARPVLLVLPDKIHVHGLPRAGTGYKASSASESRGERMCYFAKEPMENNPITSNECKRV